MELEPAVIVPGHGPPGGIEMVDTCGTYLRWLQQSAEHAVAAGLTPLEAARELDLGDYAQLLDPERLAGNLHRAFAECRGLEPGAPIDLAAAFADMVALNGGRPLRCLA
jgi:cyclase